MVLNKRDNMKIVRRIILVVIIGLSAFGGYKYITTKSHEKEMKQLEAELAENEKIMLWDHFITKANLYNEDPNS